MAETPPVRPPGPLRPVLNFAKLPDKALDAARRALDSDHEFRARVAALADEDLLGRPAWLFLVRPEGWEAELDAVLAAEEESAAEAHGRRVDDRAERRLERAREGRERLERQLAGERERAKRALEQAKADRRLRQEAQDQVRALGAELAGHQAELTRLRAELTAARQPPPATASAIPAPAAPAAPPLDPAIAAAAAGVVAAAQLAREVADRLATASRALGDVMGRAAAPVAGTVRPAPARTASRTPIRLPPGVYDDSVTAADYLVRVAGAVILVDGYNASHNYWPDVPIHEQRRRLVDALGELAARTGAEVQVVFDGAEQVEPPPPGAPRRAVRVEFSPPGTEADDVIIALARDLPVHRPVVVVSSDRRVQAGAAAGGANVITVAQLRAVLRLAGPA